LRRCNYKLNGVINKKDRDLIIGIEETVCEYTRSMRLNFNYIQKKKLWTRLGRVGFLIFINYSERFTYWDKYHSLAEIYAMFVKG